VERPARNGTVPAQVWLVSLDAVQDEKRGAIYLATLDLGRTSINVDGQGVPLSAGMNLTAEIKTGKRRVIEYLLSPIQRAASESIRER
jgi:hemolysin D